jgi:hypothetical protein
MRESSVRSKEKGSSAAARKGVWAEQEGWIGITRCWNQAVGITEATGIQELEEFQLVCVFSNAPIALSHLRVPTHVSEFS